MIAQGDASNIASNSLGQREKQSLLAMKALIERHLKEIEEGGEVGAKEEKGVLKREEEEDEEMEL
jgi:hypothetical protein